MSNDSVEKRIREKFMLRLEEALDDPVEGKKAAVLSLAAAWLDGKGRKGEAEEEANEYAQHTKRASAGKSIPDLNLDDYDAAVHNAD